MWGVWVWVWVCEVLVRLGGGDDKGVEEASKKRRRSVEEGGKRRVMRHKVRPGRGYKKRAGVS